MEVASGTKNGLNRKYDMIWYEHKEITIWYSILGTRLEAGSNTAKRREGKP